MGDNLDVIMPLAIWKYWGLKWIQSFKLRNRPWLVTQKASPPERALVRQGVLSQWLNASTQQTIFIFSGNSNFSRGK